MDWQLIVAGFAIAAAAGYIGWRGWQAWRGMKSGCSGGCGCSKSDAKTPQSVVAPEELVLRHRPKS
jgi:hypothetical protein